jgi:hypothetical protein
MERASASARVKYFLSSCVRSLAKRREEREGMALAIDGMSYISHTHTDTLVRTFIVGSVADDDETRGGTVFPEMMPRHAE